jgi:hypothetical protein
MNSSKRMRSFLPSRIITGSRSPAALEEGFRRSRNSALKMRSLDPEAARNSP